MSFTPTRYIAIKYMCKILYKRSKEFNVEGDEDTLYRFQWRWCLWLLHNTVCTVQIHVKDVEDTLYTVAPHPTRREGSL